MTAEAMVVLDKRKGELVLTGTNEQVLAALHALDESESHYNEVTVAFEGTDGSDAKLTLPGNPIEIKNALIDVYNADLIECEHEFTEDVPTDDTRWLAPDGVHGHSNPDAIRCEICGRYYNRTEEEWQYQ